MAKEVWVLVERDGDGLHDVTLEMLGEARKLAPKVEGTVCAVLISGQQPEWVDTLAHYGAQKVYVLEHALLSDYNTDAYTTALADLIKENAPEFFIMAATCNGNDLAPRLSARLKVGLGSGCVILNIDDKGKLQMIRPSHGDKIYSTVNCSSAKPWIATIRPGAIGLDKPKKNRKAQIVSVNVHLKPEMIRTRVKGFIKADPETVDLKEAEIIIAGGRGVGVGTQWQMIEDLAKAMHGSVGATRLALDLKCVTEERLIGVTGRTVAPKLYIGAGISGASQHVAGIQKADFIIAINKDKGAPIFKLADMGIVGDLHEVLPALTKAINEHRACTQGGV